MSRNILHMNKLEKYIKDNNINQSEIARQMNITRATINNWVKDKNYPPVPEIKILLKLLNTTFEEIF